MEKVANKKSSINVFFICFFMIFFLTGYAFAQDYDFDGVPRTGKYDGDTPDIGAFEWVPSGPIDYSPTVNIEQPTTATSYSTTEDSIDLGGSAADDGSLLTINWTNNRGSSGTANNVSGDWTAWSIADISLQEGANIITVIAEDDSGKTGSDSITISYTIPGEPDTEDPTVSFTGPASSSTPTISLSGSAADNQSINTVTWANDRGGEGSATNVSGDWTSWTITDITLQDGANTITLTAQDTAGNTASDSVTVTYTIPAGTFTYTFGDRPDADYPGTVEDTFLDVNSEVNANSTLLNTYTWPANTVANAIVLKCDLSSIPSSATIQSAQLFFYLEESGGDSSYTLSAHKIINHNPAIGSCNGNSYNGTSAWTANSQCYNNIPLAQADIAAASDTKNIDTATGDKAWDITQMVQNWVSNSTTNFGVLINSDNNATDSSHRTFSSTENTNSSQRPKLVITYSTGNELSAPTWTDTPVTID